MKNHAAQMAFDRKAGLLIDGARYRAGLVRAKAAVIEGLQPESMIRNAVEHAIGSAATRLGASLVKGGARYQIVMPIAVAVFSYLLRQRLRNLAIGAGVVAVAAIAATRHKRS